MHAIRVHDFGPPEVMALDELPDPVPQAGETVVAVAYAGVNFYDTQFRSGLFKRPVPVSLGLEGAGTVTAVGPGVTAFAPGDRVAWAQSPASYATQAVVSEQKLVPLPAAVSFEAAAAVLFQGLTAHHLAVSTFALGPGHTAVVHSAAGGVGTLLCRIATLGGARAIGVVSSAEKAQIARENGVSDALVYGDGAFDEAVRELTGGKGADVVYDAVGEATFEASLRCLRPRGLLAIYGEASGFVPPFDLRRLSGFGSLYVTRTSLNSYVATREEYLERANELFSWVADGLLRPRIHAIYPLADAAAAHRDIESRATTGKLLLACA